MSLSRRCRDGAALAFPITHSSLIFPLDISFFPPILRISLLPTPLLSFASFSLPFPHTHFQAWDQALTSPALLKQVCCLTQGWKMFPGLTKTQVRHHITYGVRFWLPSAPRAVFLTLFQNFCSRVLQEEVKNWVKNM